MDTPTASQSGGPTPRKLLLYGTSGIGKTTFASQAPNCKFINIGDGLRNIDPKPKSFDLAKTFQDVLDNIAELKDQNHSFESVVLDTISELELLIFNEVCLINNKENITEIKYGNGYEQALPYWRKLKKELNDLWDIRKMNVIVIAHDKIEKVRNPETDTYDQYQPDIHWKALKEFKRWFDEIFFVSYKVYIKETDEAFNRKLIQGVGDGEPYIRTRDRPAHLGKRRIPSLPFELPLKWEAYAHYIANPL